MTTQIDNPLARKPGGWKITLVLVLGLSAGVAAGFIGRDRLLHLLGAHANESQAPGKKQLWTCGMHPEVIQDRPGQCPKCHMDLEPLKGDGTVGSSTQPAHPYAAGSTVQIDPAMVQKMGVRATEVVEGPLRKRIRAVGYLVETDPSHVDINLRVNGWIEKLYAEIDGMPIEKGQPLFELYSPELQVGIEELIAARRSRDKASDDLSRKTAGTLYDAAHRKLELWGLAGQQIDEFAKLEKAPPTVAFLAPMSGHLTEKMVYRGSAVKAGDRVLRLADRREMWLDARVFESDLPYVKPGQKVQAEVAVKPGQTIDGYIEFIHPHVDEMTRAALVRVLLPNHDHTLRQNMYATLRIDVEVSPKAMLIPREAIIDTGARQVAFVPIADGKFEPRLLRTGASGDGMVQVLEGLKAGEKVVTSGQFLLDSESRLREAIQKYLSQNLIAQAPATKPAVAGGAANPASQPATKPATAWTPHVDAAVLAYLDLQQKLGAKQTSEQPLDPAALLAASKTLLERADNDADRKLAQALIDTTAQLAGKKLDEQRKAFIQVSGALIAVVRQSPPSDKVAPKLYHMHCPMTPGDWLQTQETLANPYYATRMKQCGEIRGTIAPAQSR